MKKFRVDSIIPYFELFIGEEIEAEDDIDAAEQVMLEICENIGNYVEIDLEEIEDYDREEEDYDNIQDI